MIYSEICDDNWTNQSKELPRTAPGCNGKISVMLAECNEKLRRDKKHYQTT